MLPDPWSAISKRVRSYNKLAKNCIRKKDWKGSRFWYEQKKLALVSAFLVCGVEVELADDDVRMLSVGKSDSRFHLVRDWQVNFANYENAFESACQSMNVFVSNAALGTVTSGEIASLSKKILALPFGDRTKLNRRLRNLICRSMSGGKISVIEAKLTQTELVRLVKSVFPMEASNTEKLLIGDALVNGIKLCYEGRFSTNAAMTIFSSADSSRLTTRRILPCFLCLQNASQAARNRKRFDVSIRELTRIGKMLIGPDWHHGGDEFGMQ